MDRITADCDNRLAALKANTLHSRLLAEDPQLKSITAAVSKITSGDKNLETHLSAVMSFLINHYPNHAL
jgi:hypothetical protein